MRGRAGELGLTLVEMLAVLAILAVAAGATALGTGWAARGASAEAEAHRLAARIRLAADEAMVDDTPIAFAWDARGYRFLAWDGAGWRGGFEEALAPHGLPAGLSLSVGGGGGMLPIGIDGAGAPFVARIARGGDGWTVRYDGFAAQALPGDGA